MIMFLVLVFSIFSLNLYSQSNDTTKLYNKSLVFLNCIRNEEVKKLLDIHKKSIGPRYINEEKIAEIIKTYRPWIINYSNPNINDVIISRTEEYRPPDTEVNRIFGAFVIEYSLNFQFPAIEDKKRTFLFHFIKFWWENKKQPSEFLLYYVDYHEK